MTDLQIADMLADYHKECELAETLREKADVQLKHARLIREALRQPPVIGSVCPDCLMGRDEFEPEWKCPDCRRQTDL